MSNSIEALWLAEFTTSRGTSGTGVVVLKNTKIYGGDSNYYYTGDYSVKGGKIEGVAESIHYAGPLSNVFGPLEHVRLKFEGEFYDSTMTLSGHLIQDPSQTIRISLTKRAQLR